MSAENDPSLGLVIANRYILLEQIGEGQSGLTYRAEHAVLRSRLAVKILHDELSQDEQAVQRYHQAITTAARIESDNVVKVSDFGRTDDGKLFVAMELLSGETLAEILAREGRLEEERSVTILEQVSDALGEAHELGLLHGDIRPRNIFISKRRNREVVKLLDLGLANLWARAANQGKRANGSAVDPRYVSPEHAKGQPIDKQSDVYALGLVGYELVNGSPPFVGTGTFDVLSKHVEARPLVLADKLDLISEHYSGAVDRALAKRPERRYPTVERFVEALSGRGPVQETPEEKQLREKRRSGMQPAVGPAQAEAKAQAEADAKRKAEEAKKAEEDAKRKAEEAKKAEDAKRKAEEAKKAEDAKRKAEDAKKAVLDQAEREPQKTLLGYGVTADDVAKALSEKQAKEAKESSAKQVEAEDLHPAATTVPGRSSPVTVSEAKPDEDNKAEAPKTTAKGRAPTAAEAAARAESESESAKPAPHKTGKGKRSRRAKKAARAANKTAPAATAPSPGAVPTEPEVPATTASPKSSAPKTSDAGSASGSMTTASAATAKAKAAPAPAPKAGAPSLDEKKGVPGLDEKKGVPGLDEKAFAAATVIPEALDAESLKRMTDSVAKVSAASAAPSEGYDDPDDPQGHTGDWFAEGVKAEQALVTATSSQPLPALYGSIDELDVEPKRRINSTMVLVGVVGLAVLIFGTIFLLSGGDKAKKPKRGGEMPLLVKGRRASARAVDSGVAADTGTKAAAKAPAPKAKVPKTAAKTDKTAPSKKPWAPSPKVAKKPAVAPKPAVTKPTPKPAVKPKPKVAKVTPKPKATAPKAPSKPKPPKANNNRAGARKLVAAGRAELRRGSYGKAKASFGEALKLNPRSAAARGGLGEVAFELGDYNGASKQLRAALRLNPRSSRYLVMLGNVYFKQGRTQAAVQQYRRALKVSPNNRAARSGLEAAVRKMSRGS